MSTQRKSNMIDSKKKDKRCTYYKLPILQSNLVVDPHCLSNGVAKLVACLLLWNRTIRLFALTVVQLVLVILVIFWTNPTAGLLFHHWIPLLYSIIYIWVCIVGQDNIVDDTECDWDAGLNVDGIFCGKKKDSKTTLDDTKDPFNNVPC